jgi:hypothetical protein
MSQWAIQHSGYKVGCHSRHPEQTPSGKTTVPLRDLHACHKQLHVSRHKQSSYSVAPQTTKRFKTWELNSCPSRFPSEPLQYTLPWATTRSSKQQQQQLQTQLCVSLSDVDHSATTTTTLGAYFPPHFVSVPGSSKNSPSWSTGFSS